MSKLLTPEAESKTVLHLPKAISTLDRLAPKTYLINTFDAIFMAHDMERISSHQSTVETFQAYLPLGLGLPSFKGHIILMGVSMSIEFKSPGFCTLGAMLKSGNFYIQNQHHFKMTLSGGHIWPIWPFRLS